MKLRLLALTVCALLSAARAATSAYTVKAGDTLYRIAKARNVNLDALQAVNPALNFSRALQVGQVIRLPAIIRKNNRTTTSAVVRPASIRANWSLPVRGVITTPYFGTPQHAGIDIAALLGTPIQVFRAGRVTESRFDDRTGWGWTIVIDFRDGALARYSHNQRNLVRVGDLIRPRQVIAHLGSTGNSTGPHLDYRVTINGKPVNPLALRR
ncbi:MAG: M23 family metallopeptidase [Deinococcus sp.]